MLEIKNLKKTYKAKGGVTVRALDDVSVSFPEKGMVFLLGKSGSGKSTLLNVTGGLDKPDSGEIIIKGKNSKDFSGADFDSYRNTFIGFIFQEYNILNEFNVEQNIALALQLQGKPNDKKAVEAILKQVDLEGFGRRKPNTLSGGQKQRIAIARALIKNPEIIMADEPTGALDSKTGKQVFDTLKKLSEEKLVIVVSHDRDFAEIYGDRIIELSDGKIISDTTKTTVEPTSVNENIRVVNDHTISIKDAASLKKSDAEELLALLKKQQGEVIVTSGEHDIPLVKQAIHVREDNRSEIFEETKNVETKEYDPKNTKFIRSRLPMARAMKMGASSLKTKPVRMIFTIFLTVVALTMFGAASTLMFYDPAYTIAEALRGSDNDYEMIQKRYDYQRIGRTYDMSTDEISYQYSYGGERDTRFGKAEIESLNNNNVGHHYAGVLGGSHGTPLSFSEISSNNDYYPYSGFTGAIEAGESYLNSCGFGKVAGEYPTKSDEIAISKYMFEMMADGSDKINNTDDVVGKSFRFLLRSMHQSGTLDLKITGIYDFGALPARFATLKEQKDAKLSQDFQTYLSRSYHCLAYVDPSFVDTHHLADAQDYNTSNVAAEVSGVSFNTYKMEDQKDFWTTSFLPSDYLEKTPDLFKSLSFHDLDGKPITYKTPGLKEVYLSESLYQEAVGNAKDVYFNAFNDFSQDSGLNMFAEEAKAYFKDPANAKEIDDLRFRRNDGDDDRRLERIKVLFEELGFEKCERRSYALDYANRVMEGFNTYYWNCLDEEGREAYVDSAELASFKAALGRFDPHMDGNKPTEEDYLILKSFSKSEEGQKYVTLANAWSLVWTINGNDSYPESLRAKSREIIEAATPSYESLKAFYDEVASMGYDLKTMGVYYTAYDEESSLRDLTIKIDLHAYWASSKSNGEFKVLGIYNGDGFKYGAFFMSKATAKDCGGTLGEQAYIDYDATEYVVPADVRYDYAITPTQYSQAQISNLLQTGNHYKYTMTNQKYFLLSTLVSVIETMKTVFLIIGGVTAGFAALMLFNFISTSIAAKTKEIGILRAVGARGSDLFKIFFSESGIIAAICVVLAILASIFTVNSINATMAQDVGMQIMQFGILNAGLIVAGAIVIAIVGTFIPVFLASRKPPIESIRTL